MLTQIWNILTKSSTRRAQVTSLVLDRGGTFGYETVEQNDDLLPKAAAGRGTTGAAVLDTRLACRD